ncbi:glycosyltransferase, partial [Acinetobacter baumannii]
MHDILFETHPEFFKPLFRLRSKFLMRLSAKRAMHTFTVSHFSKNALKMYYQIPEERISVTHNAVDFTRFYPGKDGLDVITNR